MAKLHILEVGTSGKMHPKFSKNSGSHTKFDATTGKKALRVVLHSDSKEWPFYVTEDVDNSSLAKPKSGIKEAIVVEAVKLDDYVKRFSHEWGFLRVNVRGTGVNVLMGASGLLSGSVDVVEVTDLVDASEYAGAKGIEKSHAYLVKKGFKVVDEKLDGNVCKRLYLKEGAGSFGAKLAKKCYKVA